MKTFGILLAAVALAGLTASAPAADKADNKKLIVGKWEAVKVDEGSLPKGSTVEFSKDGKIKVVGKKDDTKFDHEGTYTVEGDSFTVKLTIDGNERTIKVTINKISDKEMETTNEEGKKITLKKVK